MALRTRIDLTQRELSVLDHVLEIAATNMVFAERVDRAAAGRVQDKVRRAHRKSQGLPPADPQVVCNDCDNRGGGATIPCRGCGHLQGQHPNSIEARARA